MNSKNSYGGTSERNIKNMIRKYKRKLNEIYNYTDNVNVCFRLLWKKIRTKIPTINL